MKRERNRVLWFVLCVCLAWVPLSTLALRAQAVAELPPEQLAKVEAVIASEMARQQITGLSVAIAVDSKIRYANGFGLADVEHNVPARATTVYRTASIAKPITAVGVLQLAERGRLHLEAPIQKYCPAFPQKPWPVTVRQLLGHLGGVRHYKNREEVDSTKHYATLTAALEMFKDDPLLHEPGTQFSYTTFGYVLLGCAIEGATGMSYVDYIRETVFRPAGMVHTRADDAYAVIPNRARGYRRSKSGELMNAHLADTSNKIPGGGLVSTAVDLVRFLLALETGGLLKPETRERMWTRQKTAQGQETRYGLGWGIDAVQGQKAVSHSGGQQGTRTYFTLLPGTGLAIAVMSNQEGIQPADVVNRLAQIFVPPSPPSR